MDGGTVRAVALVLCLWYEVRLADFALFFACRLHDLGKQLPVCGKDCIFEIIAINPVPADALHTSMFLAVVQQQAAAVYIVATELSDKGLIRFDCFGVIFMTMIFTSSRFDDPLIYKACCFL